MACRAAQSCRHRLIAKGSSTGEPDAAAVLSPALLTPSLSVVESSWPETWSFAIDTSLLGGESPPNSPSDLSAFSLVAALQAVLGVLPPSSWFT